MERLAVEAQQRELQETLDLTDVDHPKCEKSPLNRPKKTSKNTNLNSSPEKDEKKSKKKQKLYCVCRTPYDKAR